ncbi:MAG TPA: hypothetical protein VKG78_08530 [Opitutaceae bacterium]|nr:hypothetical protein [Opitutaceae bacterium]
MRSRALLRMVTAAFCAGAAAHAQTSMRNPTSKIYVADTEGESQVDAGQKISVLEKKAVYKGEGSAIVTKANSNASIVLSNGIGIYFDVSTRTEIRGFVQAPFRPNRTDMDDEPSISRTDMFIDYGVVGVSTSKMAAGSTLLFESSLATADVHGRQAVFQVGDNVTTISLLLGDATVQAGPLDRSREIQGGQQVIVRPGKPGQPNAVEIRDIPDGRLEGQREWLYERVLAADSARKLVYFEMQSVNESDGKITLFDGEEKAGTKLNIVPVPVTPVEPPVEPTVSAANLFSR